MSMSSSMLTVGEVEIPYDIRFSEKAKDRRIIVTPGHVEVVVPGGTAQGQITDYIYRKRRWVYDQVKYMDEVMAARHVVSRYVTGAKIPYRGRRMKLTVIRSALVTIPKMTYKNGFYVEIPENLPQHMNDFLVETEIRYWLKRKLRNDVQKMVKKISKRHGMVPKGIRIKEQKHMWGSCGKDQIIHINWMLIFAPKAVLEYAVSHEVCHLKYRNHGVKFWALVSEIVPDYEIRKEWLKRNEHYLCWTNDARRYDLLHG